MSDTRNKGKPEDASILDYYHKLPPYNVINQNIEQIKGAASDLRKNANDMIAMDEITLLQHQVAVRLARNTVTVRP